MSYHDIGHANATFGWKFDRSNIDEGSMNLPRRHQEQTNYMRCGSNFFNLPVVPTAHNQGLFVNDRNPIYAIVYDKWSDTMRLDDEEPYLFLRDFIAF